MEQNINKEEIQTITNSFKNYLKLIKKNCNLELLVLLDTNVEFKSYGLSNPNFGMVIVTFDIGYNMDYRPYDETVDKNMKNMVNMIYSFASFTKNILLSDTSYFFSYNIKSIKKDSVNESHIKKLKLKINKKTKLDNKKFEIIKDFIKFINKKLTLNGNVLIDLQDKKDFDMTTGVREAHHHIKVLCKNRMLIDVLRTIAHEWVHEYQHEYMKITDNSRTKEVGGWSENHANAMAGILVKRYVFNNKELKDELF
jgi:hypothetical protein